eukprot:1313057-Alexandrium_andersonii.AAC.1
MLPQRSNSGGSRLLAAKGWTCAPAPQQGTARPRKALRPGRLRSSHVASCIRTAASARDTHAR